MIKRVEREDGPRWQVYGRRDGKKFYVGSYTSKRSAAEAEEDFRVTQRKIEAGELPPNYDEDRTFAIACEIWLKALRDIDSRSVDEYESRVKHHIAPTFAEVPIASVVKQDIVNWRDSLHGKISPSTINSVLGTLSSAFSFFVDQRWLSANPCRGVKILVRPKKVFPWLETSEQITRLLSECSPSIRTIVAVLVGTGMRLDEALHLQWDDIDLDRRIITVHRGSKGMTKSGHLRRVPIFDSVLPVLRSMRVARGGDRLLWPGGKRNKPNLPLSQPSVWLPFKCALDMASLPTAMRVHDLRHTFASHFLMDGGDIFKLSRILGHSSVAITERTYAHLKPDAFEADYGRVRFAMPTEAANVLAFARAEDARETKR